jgi:Cof subfamily protein (haloacid dehalogenase superfamily)
MGFRRMMEQTMLNQSPVVFFDLDGTLLTSSHQILGSSIEAIQYIRRKGALPIIATGRSLGEIDYVFEKTNIHSCVAFNGQYVIYEGDVIYHNPLVTENVSALHRVADQKGHDLSFYNVEKITVTTDGSELIAKNSRRMGRNYPKVDRELYLKEPIYLVGLYCKEGEEEYYQDQFPYFQFVRHSPYGCDVYPADSSKASGIEQLLRLKGLSLENTYAFGDSFNDLEMFLFVKNPVAMGNAVEVIKESAKYITTSNDEDGIYHGLKLCGLL